MIVGDKSVRCDSGNVARANCQWVKCHITVLNCTVPAKIFVSNDGLVCTQGILL